MNYRNDEKEKIDNSLLAKRLNTKLSTHHK